MDHVEQFQHHLSQAKAYFEAAQRHRSQDHDAFVASLDSMLFECARARRIGRDAPEVTEALGLDQKEFLGFMDDVAAIRNVHEHWADVINPRAPKMHSSVTDNNLKISVDETSLIVLGPEEIYKGKLNLFDVYRYVVSKLEQISTEKMT